MLFKGNINMQFNSNYMIYLAKINIYYFIYNILCKNITIFILLIRKILYIDYKSIYFRLLISGIIIKLFIN